MSVTTCVHIEVTCHTCGAHASNDGGPHYAAVAEALSDASRRGWHTTGAIRYPDCACTRTGHDWTDWHTALDHAHLPQLPALPRPGATPSDRDHR
ncbi:MAG: hypothetical protein GEV07_25895 [Streptosporangiales bacterium]|nr:hypothetical protein [Streptosporangiales bacterium]